MSEIINDNTLDEYIKLNQQYDTRDQYIYIIQCEQYVKVGRTLNPESRLLDMQVGNPFPLRLIEVFEDIPNAYAIEYQIHEKLCRYHHHGEWFECKPKVAISIAKKIIKKKMKVYNRTKQVCVDCGRIFDSKIDNSKYCPICMKHH
jgi:hypothetical protein